MGRHMSWVTSVTEEGKVLWEFNEWRWLVRRANQRHTTSNIAKSNVKLLTLAAMVDNLEKLVDKVDECLLNRGSLCKIGSVKSVYNTE